jgi:hypothetical protein
MKSILSRNTLSVHRYVRDLRQPEELRIDPFIGNDIHEMLTQLASSSSIPRRSPFERGTSQRVGSFFGQRISALGSKKSCRHYRKSRRLLDLRWTSISALYAVSKRKCICPTTRNGLTWREELCERGKVIKLDFDVVTYAVAISPLWTYVSVHASARNIYIPDETQKLSSCDSNANSPDEGVEKYGDKSKGPGGKDDPTGPRF